MTVGRLNCMNDMPLITDLSGKFYVGMKLENVPHMDKDITRFVKIDKNKDKVLSIDEIVKERKAEVKTEKLLA